MNLPAIKKLSAVLMLALPLSAMAQTGAPAIITSPLDTKQYRVLTLDNGLKVALVSDPATDKSAASLDVHVGSGSNPPGWQGLAHFLEHMLFLGNEKYPEVGEYMNFIGDHGGDTNAYTSFAHTNYFFDVSSEHLLPALDRFAQFFIAPTFNETFVARERAVVHSEYQARRKDEGRRLWSARQQLLNPEHPSSRFLVGSEHTLRDRDGAGVRQKLIEFYERHYSANLMTLAVVGREPLDQLEHWVMRLFAGIPDRQAKVEIFEQPYIDRERISSRLNVRPQKDELRVTFMFPVAGTEAHYRSKPLGYIANLLGHEGEGSLLALLESLGWAEALSAGVGYMDEVQGTFEVSIKLTEPGLQHIDEIGALLFRAIDLIAAEGIQAWRYDEKRRLARLAFRFAEERGASATARSLAFGLQRYPLEDVLRGPGMMEAFRPELIRDLLADLTPDNVLLQVVSKDAETSAKTPFYDAEFGIQPIAPATLARWKQGNPDERLALPRANRFIPERLLAHPLTQAPTIPQKLNVDDGVATGVNAWYRGDPRFGTPRAVFYFSVESPLANDSARNLALTRLFVSLVNRRLDQAGYPALLAGLNYDLYRHGTGFSVRISGYEDKQPVMLAVVLEALFVRHFDASKLALASAELERKWKNNALEPPYNQGAHELYRLLLHPNWSEAERLAALDEIGVDDLAAHAARLLEKAAITTLAHGDITRARAAEMNALLASAFAGAELIEAVDPVRVRMLNDHRVHLRSMDVDHGDSALLVYFQGDTKSDWEHAKMSLLAQLMEAPFFFNLRTTNRVGYLVQATNLNILEAPGLLFAVQSPTHTPPEINRLLDDFLNEFQRTLEGMDARTFEQIKQGLIARILTRDQRLSDRSNRYWREIDLKKFTFDSRERLAGALESLTQTDMLDYLQQVTAEQPRKLIIQSPGRRQHAANPRLAVDANAYTPVKNAIEFRKTATQFFPAD